MSVTFLPLFLVTYIAGPYLIKKLEIKFFFMIGVGMNIVGFGGVLLGSTGFLGLLGVSLFTLGALFWFIAGLAFFGNIFDDYEDRFGKVDKGIFIPINRLPYLLANG